MTREHTFSTTLFGLWAPIAAQQLIFSSVDLISVAMIGQLGETALAAVGLANQTLFLFQLLLFGSPVAPPFSLPSFSGPTEYPRHSSRSWNLPDSLDWSAGGVHISCAGHSGARAGFYSTDPAVIAAGSEYLKIWLELCSFCSHYIILLTLRSTGNVRAPVVISVLCLSLGAVLSYLLIFGAFGFPRLGVPAPRSERPSPVWSSASPCWLSHIPIRPLQPRASTRSANTSPAFVRGVLKTVLPVTLNEIIWSFGVTTYSMIYGRIGTEAIAAMSIIWTIERMAFVPFVALANAAAIMIGHRIGADEEEKAFDSPAFYAHDHRWRTCNGRGFGSGLKARADTLPDW